MRQHVSMVVLIVILSLCGGSSRVRAGDAAEALEVIQEVPTLSCLGVRWWIGGDENGNATISLRYRALGTTEWRKGMDLFRVEREGIREAKRPAAEKTLFAGSIFYLSEETAYEVELSLDDPDGGSAKKVLRMKTWDEPKLPRGEKRIPVKPGRLRAALSTARPGDALLLEPGTYKGTFTPPSGARGEPIAIVGSEKGSAILDGQGAKVVIAASGLQHVMFERLTFRNAKRAVEVNGGSDITIRHCRFEDVDYAFVGQKRGEQQKHFYIADNVIQGRSTWPRSQGIEDRRGIQVGGQGHAICHNRISGFADAIDIVPAYPCAAIDIYRNDISECTDDGIEMDYSEHNTRCFENRLTNVFQGISLQPVHGGPVYVFRNAIYNVVVETFKLHNSPSGGLIFHNSSVKKGKPLCLYTTPPVRNCISRNNLFVGTSGRYAYDCTAPMRNCDFDYDGFSGEWQQFLRWNQKRYPRMADARAEGVYPHAVRISEPRIFQSGITAPSETDPEFKTNSNDLRLSARSGAVDRGVVIRNVNDDYVGKSPDLGAYEVGVALPHYGPRRDK